MKNFQRVLFLLLAIVFLASCGSKSDDEAVSERLQLAEFYRQEGMVRAAILEIRNALQIQSDDAEAHFLFGRVLLEAQDAKAAEGELNIALRLGYPEKKAAPYLARVYLIQRRFEKVLTELAKADQNNYDVKLIRADAYLGTSKPDLAEALLQSMLAQNPDDAGALVGMAKVSLVRQQPDKVEEYIIKAVAADASAIEPLLWQGRLALAREDFVTAEAAYYEVQRLTKLDVVNRDQLEALQGIVKSKIGQNEFQEAYEYYREFVDDNPDSLIAQYEKGVDKVKQGDVAGAEAVLKDINQMAPGHTPSALLLGLINYSQGNLSEAEQLFASQVDDNASGESARRLLIATQIKLKRPKRALEMIEERPELIDDDPELKSLYGLSLYASGREEEGIRQLKEAVEKSPEHVGVRSNLAQIYLARGDKANAINQLKTALTYNPESSRAIALLMGANLMAGYLADAEQDAEILISLGGKEDNAEYRIGLQAVILIAHQSGEVEWGAEQVAKQANLERRRVGPELVLSEYYLLRGSDVDKSDEWARKALDKKPESPEGMLLRARIEVRRDNLNEAAELAKRAGNEAPTSAVPLAQLARIYAMQGYLEQAKSSAGAALIIQNRYAPALEVLALVGLAEGDLVAAESAIGQLRAQTRYIGLADMLSGDVLVNQGDMAKGEAAYASAWSRTQNHGLAVRYFQLLRANGKPDESRAAMAQWVDMAPGDDQARVLLATAMLQDGKHMAAIKHYEIVLARRPDDSGTLNNLAWLYGETGNARALPVAERALQIAPDNPSVMDTAGWIMFKDGQTDRGISLLQKAAEAEPDNDVIREHLKSALEQTGRG